MSRRAKIPKMSLWAQPLKMFNESKILKRPRNADQMSNLAKKYVLGVRVN